MENEVFNKAAFIIAFAAVAISIISLSDKVCGLSIPDMVLSLVGICATLIVGVSVYDSIMIKTTLRAYDNQIKELTEKSEKLIEIEEHFRKTKNAANILFHFTWGMIYSAEDTDKSLEQFLRAFTLSVEQNDCLRAKYSICYAYKELQKAKGDQNKIKMMKQLDLSELIPESLKDSSAYKVSEDKVKAFIHDFSILK